MGSGWPEPLSWRGTSPEGLTLSGRRRGRGDGGYGEIYFDDCAAWGVLARRLRAAGRAAGGERTWVGAERGSSWAEEPHDRDSGRASRHESVSDHVAHG